ncbi:GTPase-activating protein CdGAPr isoform X2 [Danaus plexippus]|uniref:GTPase-activating protein CdGAPr isoform X2 n=1 Tax=Danaus plexippus TaxID=13037 RepID=UPI002AB049EF|nr:GTPase-activating protein CdGAPr isoform X2 [Danaus plexippus]
MRRVFGVCSDGWILCGHNGSPHGSVMSCQSLAARAFAEPEKESHCARAATHRTVRFSSDPRSQNRTTSESECKRETPGSMSLSTLSMSPAMSQSAPSAAAAFHMDDQPPTCRFPKLEECAHFHYERVSLGGISVELVPCDFSGDSPGEGWVCLKVSSHVNSCEEDAAGAGDDTWTLTRNREHFLQLDDMLHRCIYDRKVSGLPCLSSALSSSLDEQAYSRLVADYVHHLSIIADDSINCGPALNWLQMDNKGHKLLVANEDSSSINTPAVAAAYSVRKYVSQARDEISFDVGDMISIIDMPGPQESLWWRGKRGFRVGFFPHHCVAVIGDKVPRHMTQPPPIVGSVAVAPIKPVLRKHGKLISLFRSFILSRPSRRSLKQQGILRERVFGCDLGEHLTNCGHDVPQVLVECSRAIEQRGAVDGIYRLSGGAALTQRLRAAFDAGLAADLRAPLQRDPHALASLLKMYFRELPNPLCTYQLYDSFVSAVTAPEQLRLKAVRDTVVKLPPPHYRTLSYLMRHLRRVSLLSESTGMTARNMAIVWAPNLLRSPAPQHALQGVAVQAVVTEFLICYAEELFSKEQGADSGPPSISQESQESQIELRGLEAGRRPKSLPLNPPTKLLSLEEARRRGRPARTSPPADHVRLSTPDTMALRPASHLTPKYIEVGSGPNNLPQYHTVLELPGPGNKRLKRSPSGWRGLFTRKRSSRPPLIPHVMEPSATALRPAVSCESLSEGEAAPPPRPPHHTRSSSCDSYFEPWQAELATMRLRLSPQERDRHMFSEEDDAHAQHGAAEDSLNTTPGNSAVGSAADTPRRTRDDNTERKRVSLEQLERRVARLGYIDSDEPGDNTRAKRLCKDRDSPQSSGLELPALTNVKMRERTSPRKQKPSARYSGLQQPVTADSERLTWHGKDHSTLIRIDWPETPTPTTPTTPAPATPLYDPLESDSEPSDKHTITIKNSCRNCDEEKCLKCELKAADYENVAAADLASLGSTDISYHNLNRLSAVSSSSASEHTSHRRDDLMKIMTSSHESSSGYSNVSYKQDEPCDRYDFARPDYVNLSSSTSKSSPASPLKSPLKSTISITFRSPGRVQTPDYEPIGNEDTPTNERDSVYEDVDLEKSLSIVEEASVPQTDASLPTQEARQPGDYGRLASDLIILDTPTDDRDLYSQVKFFKKSIEEVNAMILETPDKEADYERVEFKTNNYSLDETEEDGHTEDGGGSERENGNVITTSNNLNVRELANRFESPTEQKGAFTFDKYKTEDKHAAARRDDHQPRTTARTLALARDTYTLTKNVTARSLDENAFVKEFGSDRDRRKSLEVKDGQRQARGVPDLNLNTEDLQTKTDTAEDRVALIQGAGKEHEKMLSRQRIEKYKEERRNFLREKYSSQSFRSSPEQLTRIKLKKSDHETRTDEPHKFERRNTVDLGQRMRFTLARSANDLDSIPSPGSQEDRSEKMSPSFNIRDMTAIFEQKSQGTG